jgi:hypothetical protein
MDITCAMLASYVEMAQDGRVHIIGGDVDTLRAPVGSFPVTMGTPLFLIVKLMYPEQEANQTYRFKVELVGPGGNTIDLGEHPLPVGPVPPGRAAKVGFIISLQGTTFPAPGQYVLRVLQDRAEIRRLPLYLEEAPPGQ